MDRISTLSASGMASATELTVASLSNPTELNAIGLAVPDWRVCKTVSAGTDNAAWYRLDASSAAVDAPYIMASVTAGLRWVAITGFSQGQPLNIKAPSVSTAVSVLANTNNFSEVNVQNLNSGGSASSDLVVTADNGSASTHYVDLGINGSTGGAAPFITANGAYLYTTDNQLDISAQGASGIINISVGATPAIVAAFDVTNGVTFNDKTTATKQLRLQLANQTAATILTLSTGAQTASRQISVPVLAANDTFAILGAQTFTGAQTMSSALMLASGTVDLTVGNGTGNPRIIFNYAGGNTPSFSFRNNNVDRWLNYITNAESGGDSGSDLVLGRAFTDAGVGIDNIITMTRAAGTAVVLSRPLNMASSTASTSTTTGALVVTGGVGVGGRLNVGGTTTFSQDVTVDKTGGNSQFWVKVDDANQAGFAFYNRSVSGLLLYRPASVTSLNVFSTSASADVMSISNSALSAGSVKVLYSTASATTSTGALVVTGGAGIGGALNVGGALEVSSATLIKSNTTLTDGAAAAVGTLNNAPTAGNPTKWVLINDNGTIRKFPTWT